MVSECGEGESENKSELGVDFTFLSIAKRVCYRNSAVIAILLASSLGEKGSRTWGK